MVWLATLHILLCSWTTVEDNFSHGGLSLYDLGVAFLKAAEEGTYDAVIVDSSDPIGRLHCNSFCLNFSGLLHLM